MSQALSQPQAQPLFQIVLLNGPKKGQAFRLVSAVISIGRDEKNDIALTWDAKVSRKHARIVYQDGRFYIESLNPKNKLVVDSENCERAFLNDKSLFALGGSKLQFRAIAPEKPRAKALPGEASRRASRPKKVKSAQSQSQMGRVLLYGSILLIGYWLFSDSPEKEKTVELRTERQIQSELAETEKAQREAEDLHLNRFGAADQGGKAAQAQFVKGFRDYQKGQYERATSALTSCLSIFPAHKLCNRYLRLAQLRKSEVIQKEMTLGRQYREQRQYSACVSAFRNVMIMSKGSDLIFKEAQANYDACHAQIKERY